MKKVSEIISAMLEYYAGDVLRINHFLKVYAFAKAIGEQENLDANIQEILETAALVHDIGIKISEEKYHSSAGNFQQIEGPTIAQKMLERLGYEESFIERICFLIAHHHTYTNIEGIDYQILIEADFLVNIFEEKISLEAAKGIKEKYFKTKTGARFLEDLYL